MSEFDLKRLREYSIKRWPEWMGTTHGIEHWDRVAKFGRLLYKEERIWMSSWLLLTSYFQKLKRPLFFGLSSMGASSEGS